jgi:hypothetical protein
MRTVMKARSLTASFLLAAALGGCSDSEPLPSRAPSGAEAPVGDLPARQATVSGLVFDPEAFFVQYMAAGEGGDAYLFDGQPYLTYSAIPDARVRLSGPGLPDALSPASSPTGQWQMMGVLSNSQTPYLAQALPPDAPVAFYTDESAPFVLPPATHYPTTHLRPIQVSGTQCMAQQALMVGSAGALDAVARHLTARGSPTTVADLVDPDRSGGVVLIWVQAPSGYFDFNWTPLDSVAAEASAGTLVALDWALPEGLPGQSPMGFSVPPDPVSSVGYFALVLPPGTVAPVTVRFTDTSVGEGPYGTRPLPIPPASVEPRPGVSVQRVLAFFNFPPGPSDPLDDPPPPPPDESWRCLPPEPPPEE